MAQQQMECHGRPSIGISFMSGEFSSARGDPHIDGRILREGVRVRSEHRGSLAQWTLKATLPSNGVCLDPFMGTGSTGVAALSLGGKFIGVDLKRQYLARFVSRCEQRQG